MLVSGVWVDWRHMALPLDSHWHGWQVSCLVTLSSQRVDGCDWLLSLLGGEDSVRIDYQVLTPSLRLNLVPGYQVTIKAAGAATLQGYNVVVVYRGAGCLVWV